MCVTNVYLDVYPDGSTQTFQQVSLCQYGNSRRPCSKASIIENPIRKITWDEPTTEYMLTQPPRMFPTMPLTPPRSSAGSTHRLSAGYGSATSDEGLRRRDSKRLSSRHSSNSRHSESSRKEPKREHRKERIIIVEAPPTPRTPPRTFVQTFTAPNSPMSRSRPIIVDERPRPARVPSVGAVVGDRPQRRSTSSTRPHFAWDSPSSSHTSFDLHTAAEERARAEAKHLKEEAKLEVERRRAEAKRDEHFAELEAARQRDARIRAHDEAIKRRPAVPLKNRPFLAPIIDQTKNVQGMMSGLRIDERLSPMPESRRRTEDREVAARLRRDAEDAEAMASRLRERQMPNRRFSVGPAQRRERAVYDTGVYHYE